MSGTASSVKDISARLSLRTPQRHALEILSSNLTEIGFESFTAPGGSRDVARALEILRGTNELLEDFERDFVSMCFALATGVGKTRLMGAFIAYLHAVYGAKNFFILAPNLTIYDKLITDFTPNTPKYVFKGIAEFATDTPWLITGDNYEEYRGGGNVLRLANAA